MKYEQKTKKIKKNCLVKQIFETWWDCDTQFVNTELISDFRCVFEQFSTFNLN